MSNMMEFNSMLKEKLNDLEKYLPRNWEKEKDQ